jgi:aminopeptidase N
MKGVNLDGSGPNSRSFHVPGSSRHYPPVTEYHTEHIKLQLKIDLEAQTIKGSCSLNIVPSAATHPSVLHFDASGMQIERVDVDGKNTRFDYDGEVLTVKPDPVLSPSAPSLVTVWYSSKPKGGLYFVHPEKEYPTKPVQAWTQFEAEGARHCLPCRDFPDYKSTSEMILTVPDGFQMLSNGRLLSQQSSEGWTTFHWREDAPHSLYLNSFAVGKFLEIRESAEGVPLQYMFPEEKKADAVRYFGLTPDMLKTFVEIIGVKYPFVKYSQVAVHDYIYGGMENIGATTLTDTRFPDARSEEDYAARYSRPDRTHIELVSHELAHMWFGDLVTTRDWANSWLNEGFATYFEALYHEKKFGVDELRENMRAKAAVHFEEDETKYRRPIVDYDYIYADDLFDTFIYDKGAWMLHQLRYIVGDEVFFRGIGVYVKRFQYKNVDTHDFMRVMEEVSDRSLEEYFDQSFFKAGHPEFEVEYSWEEGIHAAHVSVKQVQRTGDSSMTPIFSLPCDLVFYTAGRGRVKRRVWLKKAEESYHFELDSAPTIVEFDPEEWLLKKASFKKSYALLANQLISSQDASSRRKAAEDLASFKTSETVSLLKQAATKEQYWTVRAEALRSIGKIGGHEALDALLEAVAVKHRRVRRAAVAALGEFKGEGRAHEALKKVLFNDESPYVQCEAALSLAKSEAPDAIPALSQAMKLPSTEFGVTEASLEALGYVKGKEAREIIRANLPYGLPTRVRVGSLKGYSHLGSFEDEDLRLLREIALKDKDFIVRDQLLETVAEVRDRRFADTLRQVAEQDTDNRNRRRAIELLQEFSRAEDAGGAISTLRQDVEKLRRQNEELTERVSRMDLT